MASIDQLLEFDSAPKADDAELARAEATKIVFDAGVVTLTFKIDGEWANDLKVHFDSLADASDAAKESFIDFNHARLSASTTNITYSPFVNTTA